MTSPISDQRTPILPTSDNPPVRTAARQPSSESWHRTWEHALGGGFDRWFQAPAERGDAAPGNAQAARAAEAMSQPAGSMFGHASLARSWTPTARTEGGKSWSGVEDRADHAGPDVPESAAGSTPEPATATPCLPPTQALVAQLGRLVEPVSVIVVESPWQAATGALATARAAAPDSGIRAGEPDVAADVEVAHRREAAVSRDADPASEREPLRVHAEWDDNGVRVWLGADLQGLAAVHAVTRQLQQWLGRQGVRLLGVVCNGQEVWSPASEDGPDARAAADSVSETGPAAIDSARGLPFPTNLL